MESLVGRGLVQSLLHWSGPQTSLELALLCSRSLVLGDSMMETLNTPVRLPMTQ